MSVRSWFSLKKISRRKFWTYILVFILCVPLSHSFKAWWIEGYWPLTWSEWQYASLLKEQEQLIAEIQFWKRKTNLRSSESQELLQKHVAERAAPFRKKHEKFLEKYPNHFRAMISYGNFFEEIGESETARDCWSRAMLVAPSRPVYLNNLGTYYAHCGYIPLTIQLYEAAVRLDPKNPAYHFNLGNMYFLFRKETAQLHQWELTKIFNSAIHHFKMARENDRSSFEYARSYAEAFYGMNFIFNNQPWEEAMLAWEYCLDLELEPQQCDFVRVQLVRISSYRNDPWTALRCYSKIQNEEQRQIAFRILEKAFPDTFGVSLDI